MIGIECNNCGNDSDYNGVLACTYCDSTDVSIKTVPDAYTIRGFIQALQIMAKYTKNHLDESHFLDAQHDEIYTYLTIEQLPENSQDGLRLQQLGWFEDCDYWSTFT